MKVFKTLATVLAVGAMALTASTAVFAQDKGQIGIAMPTQSSLRWISDGNELKAALEGKGYTVDLQYAEDDIPNQLAQIENMVTKGVKALVVASIDGTTLSAVLQQAADAGIKVIAYDRLIRDTANVDYYTTFDNFQVGVLQANSILKGLGYPEKQGPFNIELFGGSPDDNNAFFFYDRVPAADRFRRAGGQVRPAGHGHCRYPALGRCCRTGPHGQYPVRQLLGRLAR